MRMKRLVVALTLVLMVLSLAGPALVSARQISKSPPVKTMKVSTQRDRGGVPGTTLSAVKTAEGYWERRYDWTLDKTADVDGLTLAPNVSGTVTFTITATRSEPIDLYGVRGQICVTNGGSKPTENLTITDVVEYKVGSGKFQTLVSQPVDTSAKPVLGPGETFCYPYDVQFTPVEGAQYRNVAKVKITNHSGSINDNANNCKPGEPCGPEPKASFWLPSMPTEIDETATLDDELACPAGFTCTPSGPWTTTLTGSSVTSLMITVTNVSACDAEETRVGTLTNSATLTESDTHMTHSASAAVTLYADCPTTPGGGMEGCTLTQGYWQRWTDRWPAGYSPDDTFYNSGQTWLDVLQTPPAGGNAYYILAHQFIAATLNVANGATAPAEVQTALANAAAYFAAASPTTPYPSGYQRSDLIAWASTLDQFNNGYIGPGHCD